MGHPYEEESRQASRAALGDALPDDHPGYVPSAPEAWKPYARCGACGRTVALHVPDPREVEEQSIVVAHAYDPQVGPLCSYACLYKHQPDHPVAKGLHPDSIRRDLKLLEIEERRAEIARLLETL